MDLQERKLQVQRREQEVSALISEISEEGFMQNVLKLDHRAQLDMEKLVMSGHSFGGITAIGATMRDERIKACLSQDPWSFPY